MNKYNISVLAEAKEEYTRQLINILYPHMYIGVKSIYDAAYKFCKKSGDKNILKKFQLLLSTIPDWNQNKVNEEFERICNDAKCDWIEDLITAVFVSHTKVLSSIKLKKKSKTIELDVPEGPYFLHKCYIEVARNFWKKPYLLHIDFPNLEIQRNLTDSENVIKESIIETIRKLLPVKHILKEYLGNDFEDDENDITSTVSLNTKNNLRKIVKQEIEQSLSKKSEESSSEKLENFSRIEITDEQDGGDENTVKTPESMEENKDKTVENVEEANVELMENVEETRAQTVENVEEITAQTVENVEEITAQTPKNVEETTAQTPENVEETTAQTPENVEETTAQTPENVEETTIQTPENVEETTTQTVENVEEKTNQDEIDLGSVSENTDDIIDKETKNIERSNNSENDVVNNTENDVVNNFRENDIEDIRKDIRENIKEKSEENEFSFFEDAAPF